jgi:hypothetical protein
MHNISIDQKLTFPNQFQTHLIFLNPGRRGEKPATNRLSYGAAITTPAFPFFLTPSNIPV